MGLREIYLKKKSCQNKKKEVLQRDVLVLIRVLKLNSVSQQVAAASDLPQLCVYWAWRSTFNALA